MIICLRRILYYQPRPTETLIIPNKGPSTVNVYYPLLADEGIPCKLPKNVDGVSIQFNVWLIIFN